MTPARRGFAQIPVMLPLLALLLVLLLSGCAGVRDVSLDAQSGMGQAAQALAPLAVLDVGTVITTDKTMVDHVVGWAEGQDCSTIRYQNGGHYCQDYYENHPEERTLYCYRTLAAVTCYDQPSGNPADRLVGVRLGGRPKTH